MGWKEWFALNQLKTAPQTKSPYTVASIRRMSNAEINAAHTVSISLQESMSLSPEQRVEYGLVKRRSIRSYGNREPQLAQNIVASWVEATNSRRQHLAVTNELKNYYISRVILKTMKDDTLNSDHKGRVLDCSSDNENIKKEWDQFVRDVRLDDIISSITKDLINNGEYTLRLEVDPLRIKGVMNVHDDLNQLGILALYDKGAPSSFMVFMNDSYQLIPAGEYVHFILGDERERIKLQDAFDTDRQIDWTKVDPQVRQSIPDFVRVGEPFFFGIVSKIRELHLLEQLIVALKLNIITRSRFVALKVPAAMPQAAVTEAILEMEEMLNSESGLDVDAQLLTIADIMTQAGRWKVIPNFADEKGTVDALDVREDPDVQDILNSIADYRKMILASVGIPYSLIYGDEAAGTGEKGRAGEIRRFGRYARTIAGIQKAVIDGVKQIFLCHLVNKNHNQYNITSDDFDVFFINTMVDLSLLERMEYDDAKQEMIIRKVELINSFMENELLRSDLHPEGIFEWLEESLNDLTDGIPLFKSHITKPKHQAQLQAQVKVEDQTELHDVGYIELKNKVIGSVMDKFMTLQQMDDLDDTEQELEGLKDDISKFKSQSDDFIKTVALNFASMRKKRKDMVNNGNGKH